MESTVIIESEVGSDSMYQLIMYERVSWKIIVSGTMIWFGLILHIAGIILPLWSVFTENFSLLKVFLFIMIWISVATGTVVLKGLDCISDKSYNMILKAIPFLGTILRHDVTTVDALALCGIWLTLVTGIPVLNSLGYISERVSYKILKVLVLAGVELTIIHNLEREFAILATMCGLIAGCLACYSFSISTSGKPPVMICSLVLLFTSCLAFLVIIINYYIYGSQAESSNGVTTVYSHSLCVKGGALMAAGGFIGFLENIKLPRNLQLFLQANNTHRMPI